MYLNVLLLLPPALLLLQVNMAELEEPSDDAGSELWSDDF
jgi:hypothetical protein